MLGTLKLSKTLKSSRDDLNVKYKNSKLYLTLNSSRDDFNVLDNFNVSSIKTANGILFRREITYRLSGSDPRKRWKWWKECLAL